MQLCCTSRAKLVLSVLVLLGVSLGLILVLGHGEPALDTIHDEYNWKDLYTERIAEYDNTDREAPSDPVQEEWDMDADQLFFLIILPLHSSSRAPLTEQGDLQRKELLFQSE